ncbi:hypothetical protein Goari_016728 [Gossypium aridum]|uniref:RNase H type-1 domain-containing protein n=1 Tax=Gossypium aridum TaxID=34290 RepID=A0A7J8WJD7_GOSAI|nr:hypothetical protein [Gossypium aridum]
MAEVIDIKTDLGLFISMGWPMKVPLVNESSSRFALEWLLERNYFSWTMQNLFISIDCGFNQFYQVQFTVTHWQDNGIADALAKASIMRPLFSKDW